MGITLSGIYYELNSVELITDKDGRYYFLADIQETQYLLYSTFTINYYFYAHNTGSTNGNYYNRKNNNNFQSSITYINTDGEQVTKVDSKYKTWGEETDRIAVSSVAASGRPNRQVLNSETITFNVKRINGYASFTVNASFSNKDQLMDTKAGMVSPLHATINTTYTGAYKATHSTLSSISNTTIDKNISFKWTPFNSSFDFKLKLSYKDWSVTYSITDGITANSEYTYTLKGNNSDLIKCFTTYNSITSAEITVTLTTYSGTTLIGSSEKKFTLSIPDSDDWKPKISSLTISPYLYNGNPSDNPFSSLWVQNCSKIKWKITGASLASKGSSPISKISFSGGGVSQDYTSSSDLTSLINGSEKTSDKAISVKAAFTVTCTITDARGFKNSATASVSSVNAYTSPSFNLSYTSVARGSEDVSKGYMDWKINYSSTPSGNLIYSLVIQVFNNSTNAEVTTLTLSKPNSTQDNYLLHYQSGTTIKFTESQNYSFVLTATDYLGRQTTEKLTLSPAYALLSFAKEGQGLGIGIVAPNEKLVKINLPVNIMTDITFGSNDLNTTEYNRAGYLGSTINSSGEPVIYFDLREGVVGSTMSAKNAMYLYKDRVSFSQPKMIIAPSNSSYKITLENGNITIPGTLNAKSLIASSMTLTSMTLESLDVEKITSSVEVKGLSLTKTTDAGLELYHNAGTPYIDFHGTTSNQTTTDREARIIWLENQLQFRSSSQGENTSDPAEAFSYIKVRSVNYGSDKRIKENIEDFPNEYLNLLSDLQVKKYNFIGDSNKISVGLIAQDVLELEKKYNIEKSFLVGGTGKTYNINNKEIIDYYGIDYNIITMMLLKKIQILEREIKELKGV